MRLAILYNLRENQVLKLKIDKVTVIRVEQIPLSSAPPLYYCKAAMQLAGTRIPAATHPGLRGSRGPGTDTKDLSNKKLTKINIFL